ncbi:hypothetical protein [Nesterenkonia muleiensis]|uniref:hypothetical protein n=1 Tax=Nesterenkonia muleiensis TaxID=2282648 RepID=UPI000E7079E4|nr:hypothetical protein [Nesterenkonia muleiensis]
MGHNRDPDLDVVATVKQIRRDVEKRQAIKESTVTRCQVQFEPKGTIYTYAAIFAEGRWYNTRQSHKVYAHDAMLSLLTGSKVIAAHIATDFE